jgi:hypothetical protein
MTGITAPPTPVTSTHPASLLTVTMEPTTTDGGQQ